MSEGTSVKFTRLDEPEDNGCRNTRTCTRSSSMISILPKYKKRSILLCIPIVVIIVATMTFVIVIYGRKGFHKEREIIEYEETNGSVDYSGRPTLSDTPPNILLIVVDDLRPTLSCYGDAVALTPNMDQIAEKGYLFSNAHAQQAFCAPSRTSLLTSRRPDSTRLYDSGSYWRDAVGNFTTMPQHFYENGYHTVSAGKIFHNGIASNHTDDYPYSWSQVPFHPSTDKYKMSKVCPSADGNLHANLVCPVSVQLQPEGTLPDIESTDYSIEFLRNYSGAKPFFLAVGYHKPHIPFKFPKQFLDLYPISSIDLAPNKMLPKKLPHIAWAPWTDVRSRDDIKQRNVTFPYGPLPDDLQRLARQGYYASVSFVDDLIGRLLQALEETGLAKNTIIVLFGDHGWSLGEHQEWAKYSNFDVALRVPLIIADPKLSTSSHPFRHIPPERSKIVGRHEEIGALAELVDIFPTLSDLAHLTKPPLCSSESAGEIFCTEGVSLAPLMLAKGGNIPWKSAAFGQYPRPAETPQANSDSPDLKDIRFMGYTMKTEHYRYTEWVGFDPIAFRANWSDVCARELYHHDSDPLEDDNVVEDPSYETVVRELAEKLRKGWRGALPKTVDLL